MINSKITASLDEATLELSDKAREIVTSCVYNTRTKHIVYLLNHKYDKKTITSPIGKDWSKNIKILEEQLKRKKIDKDDVTILLDNIDNNSNKIISVYLNTQKELAEKDAGEDNQSRKQKEFIRKYTGNGTLPLHESIVIVGLPSTFLRLTDGYKPQYVSEIETTNKILYPNDTIDTQNPLPYVFESIQELEHYLAIANTETFETLYDTVESIFRKYVNAEDHYITVLSADIIYSCFQDKFGITHYNVFIGDNGSGKNSALLVFKFLGYRVFYIVSASAPNYFTFLGDVEECQGSTAEDEAEDIGYDKEKKKILKSGYCSGGTVPKVDLSFGRTQDSYLTYCHKWFAMEEQPDYKTIKGVLDRAFVYNFVIGKVPHNIKDVLRNSGDPKFKQLHDELIHIRKLLFAFRMVHYNDTIPDIKLNVIHRNEELTKPLLRLFSYRNDAPKALEKIRLALSKFVLGRNESKKNSIESKLYEVVKKLQEGRDSKLLPEEKELEPYTFFNEDIFAQVKALMDGKPIPGKDQSFYSTEYGAVSHKQITGLYKSKLKAESFRQAGSGKRGLQFKKEWLDRLKLQYEVPNEIEIVTDVTDVTHSSSEEGGQNTQNNDGNYPHDEENKNTNDKNNCKKESLILPECVTNVTSVTDGDDRPEAGSIGGDYDDDKQRPNKKIIFWSRLTELARRNNNGTFKGVELQESLISTSAYADYVFLIKEAVDNREIEAVEGQYDTFRMVGSK